MRSNHDEIADKEQIQLREVNEDNVLVRNVLVEFEDSLKYVSNADGMLGFLEALVDGKDRQHCIISWPGSPTDMTFNWDTDRF